MPQTLDCAEKESPFTEIAQVEQFMLWIDSNDEDDFVFYQEVLSRTNKAINAIKTDVAKKTNILNYLPYTIFLMVDAFIEGDISSYTIKFAYYTSHYDYMITWNIRSLINLHYDNQTEEIKNAIDERDIILSSYKKRIDVFELDKEEIGACMPWAKVRYITNKITLAEMIVAFLPLDEFFQDVDDIRRHHAAVKKIHTYVAENEVYIDSDNFNPEKTRTLTTWLQNIEEVIQ
jgi:hypothetical protein